MARSTTRLRRSKIAIYSPTSPRDVVEEKLIEVFGERLIPVEKAGKIIASFKTDNFAMSQVGMMLYCNGYSLRGTSHRYPNGLLYYDGENSFGVGYFAKEGETEGHVMLAAPHGPRRFEAVQEFIDTVRKSQISNTSMYIRHLSKADYENFLQLGMKPIEADPWHPEVLTEDEHFSHRMYYLDDWLSVDKKNDLVIGDLPYPDSKSYRRKPRLGYNRFKHFLKRNNFFFELRPYTYSPSEKKTARAIVENYFAARRRRGGVIGSTPEDYYAIVSQQPDGKNGKDYFSYLAYIRFRARSYPVAFFVGERLADGRAGLYSSLSARFTEDAQRLPLQDITGYTALPQYVYLQVFGEMYKAGIRVIDLGGSETAGLDHQKRQLGGRFLKTYWVVAPSVN